MKLSVPRRGHAITAAVSMIARSAAAGRVKISAVALSSLRMFWTFVTRGFGGDR
jgi:hypothetical protein